jgi:hypothetical protein
MQAKSRAALRRGMTLAVHMAAYMSSESTVPFQQALERVYIQVLKPYHGFAARISFQVWDMHT